MDRMSRQGARAGAAVLFAAACGGSAAPEPRELRAAASQAVFASCGAAASALCGRAGSCSPAYVRFFFESVADCEAMVRETCASRYAGPGAASAIDDCRSAAEVAPCEIVTDPTDALAFSTAALSMLRACRPSPGQYADHEPCLRDGDCASGACGELRRGGGCMGCVPRRRVGDACPVGGEGQARCEPGSACVGGTCRALLPVGASCAAREECASAACEGGRCAPLLGEGAPCSKETPACDLGRALVCGEDATCAPLAIVGPGEACDPLPGAVPPAGTRLCDARARCGDARTCEALPRSGEPCTDRCRIGLWCVDGRCRPLLGSDATACVP